MPRLADLQKRSPRKLEPREARDGREETLVVDNRALLTPSQQVDAKFWAALGTARPPRREPGEGRSS
jgi:hypothetical protein